MRAGIAVAALLAACSRPAPPAPSAAPPAAAPAAPAAPAELPAGAEASLVMERCLICHTHQMVLMQRLTAPQWKKTVDKMKGWGAPLNDAEAAQLATYLARHLGPDVPDLERPPGPKPEGG